MGSVHNSASTSSMSSSSSSETCQGNSSSKRHSKRKSQQSVSVAALRSHFEGLKSATADERSSKRRSTSASPAGARRWLDARSTSAPVNRGRPVTPVCGRSQQEITTTRRGDLDFHCLYCTAQWRSGKALDLRSVCHVFNYPRDKAA